MNSFNGVSSKFGRDRSCLLHSTSYLFYRTEEVNIHVHIQLYSKNDGRILNLVNKGNLLH